MTALHDVTLPDGWRYEKADTDQIVITSPGPQGGCVTVDFDRRGFRLGYCVAGRLTSEGTYKGRGWKQALVAAAIRQLDSVYPAARPARPGSKAKAAPAASAEFSVSFEKTVSMTYYTEVWARDEADAVAIAEAEADNHAWNEGHLVDTSKPKVRRLP